MTSCPFMIPEYCPCYLSHDILSFHDSRILSLLLSHDILSYHCPCYLSHDILSYHCPCYLSHDILSYHCPCYLSHGILSYHCPCYLSHDILSYHCPCYLSLDILSYGHILPFCWKSDAGFIKKMFSSITIYNYCLHLRWTS
jgi:hypothetical protein